MSVWEISGWLGNACCFARFLLQWRASERAGRSVAPEVFWWLSLAASAFLLAYVSWRGEPVLLFGLVVMTGIYARNLWLHRGGRGLPLPLVVALGLGAALGVTATELVSVRGDLGAAPGWLVVGVTGQVFWTGRFLVQWWSSERARYSHFPLAFWWVSLVGNSLLLAYCIHRRDPVYTVGLSFGPLVQVRNLILARRARRGPLAAGAEGP